METPRLTGNAAGIPMLETKYRDIADGNSFYKLLLCLVKALLETKYRDIADSKQVY